MGLGSFLKKAADPGDLVGGLSGKNAGDAAKKAAKINNDELIRQFELSQENLRPFLETAQRQLPGIEEQLSPEGFAGTLGQLRPEIEQFLNPVQAGRKGAITDQLSRSGLSPNPDLINESSKIDPRLFNELLLGTEADLFGNRLALSGIGEGAGNVLSTLGNRTGAGIAESNINSQLAQQQAKAAGTQNALSLAGLGASFFSDERLKENIEIIGDYKGLRVIRWNWKDFVPESWKDVNVGFSAQQILEKYPQFVNNMNGFLSINKDSLLNHLESV